MSNSETSGNATKMYILVLDYVPNGFAINAAAHASLACYVEFAHMPMMQDWLADSFKKVTVKVTVEQLKEALEKEKSYHVNITESNLDNKLLAVAFAPRAEWDPFFKTLPLWQ